MFPISTTINNLEHELLQHKNNIFLKNMTSHADIAKQPTEISPPAPFDLRAVTLTQEMADYFKQTKVSAGRFLYGSGNSPQHM